MTPEELNSLPEGTKVRVKVFSEMISEKIGTSIDDGFYLPQRTEARLFFNCNMQIFCGHQGTIKRNKGCDEVVLSFNGVGNNGEGWVFCAAMLEPVFPPPAIPVKAYSDLMA